MMVKEIESRLRELLLPVFGLDSVEDIRPSDSLVRDLGAESLDFVDMMYVVERNFGVVLKTREIILGGATLSEDSIFEDGELTKEGALLLKNRFPDHAHEIKPGASKIALYSMITVYDMASMIHAKMEK